MTENDRPDFGSLSKKAWFKPTLLIVTLWLGMRALTSFWAALVSTLSPMTAIEAAIPLWPPVTGWLERVLLAPWLRWDVEWYLRIIEQGYRAADGTAQFHPLYPWLALPLTWLGLSALLSLLLVSTLSGLAFLLAFYRLAALDLDDESARTAVILLIFCPLGFVLFTPYSESLFLLLSALCLWWARRQKWWLAGLMGGLAALTRQQGIFLLVPVFWEWWISASRQRNPFSLRRDWKAILSMALIPLGLLVWMLYRGLFLADVNPDLSSLQALIYSVLISPSASEVVTVQAFLPPWQALGIALQQLGTRPDADLISNALLAIYFLLILAWGWRKMRTSYRLYSLTIYLVSFSYYTGPVHPYMGLARHLLLAFPIFIGLGAVAQRPWQRLSLMGLGIFLNAFLILEYVFEAWVL